MPKIISLSEPERREQEFLRCLIKELRLETASIWRDSSGRIHLRLTKRLTPGRILSNTSPSGAIIVVTGIIVSVRVSFPWNRYLTEGSALALAQSAVADHPLLETSDHDVGAEEWLHLQEELQELLDDHKLFKCQGLTRLAPCDDCKSLYGLEGKGAALALKLARLDSEYKEALEDDDDEFDPREFVSPG